MMHKKQGALRLTKGKRLLGAAVLALLSAGAMAQQKTLYVGMNGGVEEEFVGIAGDALEVAAPIGVEAWEHGDAHPCLRQCEGHRNVVDPRCGA